jgi:hypothetical protein
MCLKAGSGGKHTFVFLHWDQCVWDYNSLMKKGYQGRQRKADLRHDLILERRLRHARGALEGIYWYRHLSSSNITSVQRGQQDNSRHSGW